MLRRQGEELAKGLWAPHLILHLSSPAFVSFILQASGKISFEEKIEWQMKKHKHQKLKPKTFSRIMISYGPCFSFSSFFFNSGISMGFLFLILDFIYLFEREHREAETQAEGEAGSSWGA